MVKNTKMTLSLIDCIKRLKTLDGSLGKVSGILGTNNGERDGENLSSDEIVADVVEDDGEVVYDNCGDTTAKTRLKLSRGRFKNRISNNRAEETRDVSPEIHQQPSAFDI